MRDRESCSGPGRDGKPPSGEVPAGKIAEPPSEAMNRRLEIMVASPNLDPFRAILTRRGSKEPVWQASNSDQRPPIWPWPVSCAAIPKFGEGPEVAA